EQDRADPDLFRGAARGPRPRGPAALLARPRPVRVDGPGGARLPGLGTGPARAGEAGLRRRGEAPGGRRRPVGRGPVGPGAWRLVRRVSAQGLVGLLPWHRTATWSSSSPSTPRTCSPTCWSSAPASPG